VPFKPVHFFDECTRADTALPLSQVVDKNFFVTFIKKKAIVKTLSYRP
jgi:hypothetical protein